MKLRNWLKEQDNENKIICLGSSSSYFWFGTIKETLLELKMISDRERKKLIESVERLKEKKKYCERRIHDSELILKREKSVKKARELKEYIILNQNMIPQIETSISDRERELASWVDVGEREIVDMYDRIMDDGIIALKIKGHEQGSYWTLDEWKRSGFVV